MAPHLQATADTPPAEQRVKAPEGNPIQQPANIGKLSWADRFRQWKIRKIASPAFRRMALRNPFTRATSNKHANALYAMTAGFVHSQILRACVELEILTRLYKGEATTQALAAFTAVPEDRLERLLCAAEALDLVTRLGDQPLWAIGERGAVVATNPGIRALVMHHGDVYNDIADIAALLKNPDAETRTAKFWAYVDAASGPKDVEQVDAARYSHLMRVTQDMVIDEVLACHSFAPYTSLIDVGGGSGTFISAAAKANPAMQVGLIDLPPVAAEARNALSTAPFADRLHIHGGSFFDSEIPKDADCYSLVRVLYDHGDEAAIAILKNIRKSMSANDTLLIAEPMAGKNAGEKQAAAYFHIYLLAMRSGRCRSAQDHFDLLKAAGFTRFSRVRTHLPVATGLITAKI